MTIIDCSHLGPKAVTKVQYSTHNVYRVYEEYHEHVAGSWMVRWECWNGVVEELARATQPRVNY